MLLEMRTHSVILVAQKSFCCMKSLGLPSFLLLSMTKWRGPWLVGGARGYGNVMCFCKESFQKENISQCFEKLVGLFGTEARSLETLQPLENAVSQKQLEKR
jgi:hypothetical protein